jgi:serine/threonine protein kinase
MSTDDDAKTLADRSHFGDVTLTNVGAGTVVFGRYRLEREIGRGGMGVVWLARDERVDVEVALKFLPDVVARDGECVNELKRELRRGLNLTHPGIIRVYSFEQDERGAAISMEYVDGTTLGALKTKQAGGCFDWDELLPWVEQLCGALEYAHEEARIVHRDLKPRNLMLTMKGRLKVADFGVATSLSETMTRASVRKDGSGTPPYMSPQQAFGENPTPSDDIYSLGATLYELLTGRAPFYQGNILAQVQQRVPPTMAERREVLKVIGKKPIPENWERTIAACLAKEAEDRPQRASEVLESLRGLRQPPRPDDSPHRPINPAVTLSTAGHAPYGSRHREDADAEEADTVVPPSRTPPPVPPSMWAERRQNSGNPGLAFAALLSAFLIGFAIWWSQRGGDEERGGGSDVASKDWSIDSEPLALPTPVQATAANGNDGKPPVQDVAKEPVPTEAQLQADAEAAAAGRIPQPEAPWTNTLYMKFAPVAGVGPLVGVHEVRVSDYREFARATKRRLLPTEFDQGDNHPVVNVSWIDTQDFCEWLTKTERADGRLGSRQRYRLLTDAEWSTVVGLTEEQGTTPEEKASASSEVYPWGADWPPPAGAGNLAGEGETLETEKEIAGYKDEFSHTAQVEHFQPTPTGIYDLAGNVAEWVEDWFNARHEERTVRGSAYLRLADGDMRSSFRWGFLPTAASELVGFRLALDTGPAIAPTAPVPATPMPAAAPTPIPIPPAPAVRPPQ